MARGVFKRSVASRYRDYRGVAQPVGAVVTGLGVAILLCAAFGILLDWFLPTVEGPLAPPEFGFANERYGGALEGAGALGIAGVITILFGVLVYYYGRAHHIGSFGRREATLAVTLIWLAAGAAGAIPFMIGAGMSPADAFFEAVSGLTTTGATVITDIDGLLSRPLLLWRSLIQWLGGMGIVVLFVAIFPNVGAGGKHMFRGEVPGTIAEGLKPRIGETSFTLWKIYAFLTVLEGTLLILLGMDPFEAICHAFTTMSTGGFSTRDGSVGEFNQASIEYTIATFMFIGSLNYGLYYSVIRTGSLRNLLRNPEFRVFIVLSFATVLILAVGTLHLHGNDFLESFRRAYFMVGTTISSTGYGDSEDYMAYPEPVLATMLGLMFIGGCAGSTAGGIKVERVVLMIKLSAAQVRRFFRPNAVAVVRMGRSAIPPQVLNDVSAFFVIFMLTMGAGILLISAIEHCSLPTAFGAILTSMSNMGPAPFYEDADNFASYSSASKVIFSLAMLLGRLEFFTLFALVVPGFWKR